MKNKRFLIVEDEAIVALNIANIMRRLGYDVVKTVASAEAAIKQNLELNPDLILMDISLNSHMDGIEAAKVIHETSEIPIIFLTAFSDQETLVRAMGVQSYGYVIKPFNERQLHAAILVGLNQAKDQRLREEELVQQIEKEKELHQRKSRFVSMVSHEFKTPLATILVSSDLIHNYEHKVTFEKKTELFERIKLSVTHMSELLDDVLMIGQAEAERLEFNPSAIDIVQFFQTLVKEMQFNATSTHQIAFRTQVDHLVIEIDKRLMRLAITNLLSNAIKYSPDGKPILFTISISSNNMLVLMIKDKGIGIPQQDQRQLFKAFNRAGNVGTIDGTGLGLYITKMVIELHDGHISVDSEEGAGTSFCIQIPIRSSVSKNSVSEPLVHAEIGKNHGDSTSN